MHTSRRIFIGFGLIVLFPVFLGTNILALANFFERLEIAVSGVALLFLGVFTVVVSFGGFLWVALKGRERD